MKSCGERKNPGFFHVERSESGSAESGSLSEPDLMNVRSFPESASSAGI